MKALPQGGSLANGNFGLGDVENESEAATSLGISEHLYMFASEMFRSDLTCIFYVDVGSENERKVKS